MGLVMLLLMTAVTASRMVLMHPVIRATPCFGLEARSPILPDRLNRG